MKNVFKWAALMLLMVAANFAKAQDDEAAMMAAWHEAMAVGPEHEFLKKMEGNWAVTTTSMNPGQTETSTGKATIKMVLGGRFLEEQTTGKSMGMPFEGHSTMGYDNVRKKFHLSWIDNFGTGFMVGDGTREGDKITFIVTYPNVMGKGDDNYKIVYNIDSEKKHTMMMYMLSPENQEMKMMEVVYTRTK